MVITFFFFFWQQKQSNKSKLEGWDSIKLHSSVQQNEVKSLSRVPPHGLYNPWNYPGQNIWVGSCSLLQGIFPTQGSNTGLPHCGQLLHQLSHRGSPRVLEWVAYPFSRGSSLIPNLSLPHSHLSPLVTISLSSVSKKFFELSSASKYTS